MQTINFGKDRRKTSKQNLSVHKLSMDWGEGHAPETPLIEICKK